jgi:hypothetical protein
VPALLERLLVEERGHPGHRQRVVVDRAGQVLVVGGELVADLGVELLDEAGGGHGVSFGSAAVPIMSASDRDGTQGKADLSPDR